MTLNILTTDDRDQWVALLDQLPHDQRDIHYHPDYLAIYEKTYSDQSYLVVWEGQSGTIFKPIMVRDIPKSISATKRRDFSSVYGYGGALATGQPNASDKQGFAQGFMAFAEQNAAVTDFTLLNPKFTDVQKDILPSGQTVDYRKEVVVADLTPTLPEIWARIDDRQRKAAMSARKAGVEVIASDGSDADYDAYHARYLETMDAVNAREFWHFPDDYFHNCRDCLGPDHVTLLHAQHDGKIIASFFHIHMYDTVYYHFSCADLAARKLNPTPLLMLDSLIWAKGQGYKLFHLGGGRTDGADPLFTFKNSFSHQTLPLYSTQSILDPTTYESLTNAVKSREKQTHGDALESAFFPRYRLQS